MLESFVGFALELELGWTGAQLWTLWVRR